MNASAGQLTASATLDPAAPVNPGSLAGLLGDMRAQLELLQRNVGELDTRLAVVSAQPDIEPDDGEPERDALPPALEELRSLMEWVRKIKHQVSSQNARLRLE